MTLSREIQGDIVNHNVLLSSVLRKAKILAVRLKNKDFSSWVDKELNGYAREDDIPEYRILHTESYSNLLFTNGNFLKNAPIDTTGLPEEIQEFASVMRMVGGVRSLESLVEDTGEKTIRFSWPGNFVASFSRIVYEGVAKMQAWKVVSINQIEGILDTIRNRLLNFLLELEELIPETNEQIQRDTQDPNGQVTKIFNNNIFGNHTVITTGHSVTQSVTQQLAQENLQSLEEALKTMGIGAEDIQSLVGALEKDGERTQEQGFGEQISGWKDRMMTKMVSEGWEKAKGIAPSMVIDILTKYFGWK